MEHWWAFHACVLLVSTAKQIFCIFMLGYTTRKWSFPGLWRQWHHRRSPCSAWDVDTAKPWWSRTVAQHFPTSWAPSPPLKQAGPSCHVWMLYLGQTRDGAQNVSCSYTNGQSSNPLNWMQLCRLVRCYCVCDEQICARTKGCFLCRPCSVVYLPLWFHFIVKTFFALVVSAFALLKWFLKHPSRGDGPVNALLCAGARLQVTLTGFDK